MSNKYRNVVIDYSSESRLKDIDPEYIYMTIPAEYVCVYHKILVMLADYGVELIKDCKASCTNRNLKVIECFNMFNAACAARKLGKVKEAELMIKYIVAQMDLIYDGKDNAPSIVFPIDSEGQLKAIVGCGSKPRFRIDIEDGELYEEYMENILTKKDVFALDDEDIASE